MVARVEVYHPGIVAKNGEEVVGEGIKNYDLPYPTPKNPTQNRLSLYNTESRMQTDIITLPDRTEITVTDDPGARRKPPTIIYGRDSKKGPEYLIQNLVSGAQTLAIITHIPQDSLEDLNSPGVKPQGAGEG